MIIHHYFSQPAAMHAIMLFIPKYKLYTLILVQNDSRLYTYSLGNWQFTLVYT